MAGLFERINFFKGLFMQAEDWQKEQRFHMEKQRFHNQYLHTPGVAFACPGEFKVTASQSGTAITVAPGYGLDGEGHDLYSPEPQELKLPPLQNFKPPSTIYVTVRWNEEKIDMRDNDANPQHSGYAVIAENTVLEITGKKPDNHQSIELARVALSDSPSRIKDAEVAARPVDNEIDLTHVPAAGARVAGMRRELGLSDLGTKIMDTAVQVRTSFRKSDATSIFIEKTHPREETPMYMVNVQAIDDIRIHWWIECHKRDESFDYTLNIKSDSNRATTVKCRVYRLRL